MQDGSKYEGSWRVGRRHGRGMMMYADGDVYEGDWVEDQRSGLGILRTACGDRFEGSWMHDRWEEEEEAGGWLGRSLSWWWCVWSRKEGPGTYFFVSTGKMYEGEWAQGVAKVRRLPACLPTCSAMDSSREGPSRLRWPDTRVWVCVLYCCGVASDGSAASSRTRHRSWWRRASR